ncbi:hypothetical protein M9458_033553, partial [Cirrhinus mrigala]
HFTLVAEDLPYNTIEEVVGLCPVGVDACGSFSFISQNELIIDNFTLPAGKQLAKMEKDWHGVCWWGRTWPLQRFSFLCPSEESFMNVKEIMSSFRLSCRRFRSINEKSTGSLLVFSPVYEISAIMH